MSLHEIVLPETRPETEWVRGRALQKVSPTYRHGSLQGEWWAELKAWARAGLRGRVAVEWRFRVRPPGGITRPLVPDVAFLSYAALAPDAPAELCAMPRMAPTVAVEILSADDRRADVEDKIVTYLAAGSSAVLLVDPATETVTLHDADGSPRTFARLLEHRALPGLRVDVPALFERARE
jgi:Uma2 family endonuclease